MCAAAAAQFEPGRFSTLHLPERERVPFWREFFDRNVIHCEMAPQSDDPFRAEAALLAWPGLRAMRLATPAHYWRTRPMVADGDDSIVFLVNGAGLIDLSQRRTEASIGPGEALGVLHAESSRLMTSQVEYVAFGIPRRALAPLLPNVEDAAMRLVRSDNEALRLLRRYVALLRADPAITSPELRHAAITYAHDLIALALGATRDGAEIAFGRGVRAARLRAVKADILEHLASLELCVAAVARRQRISVRYVHMLFETEGTTFSKFVLGQRLLRAYRMLTDPRLAGINISTVAFDVGFGDLSYFNRNFRRRFGASPSEFRDAIRSGGV